jgi:tripartite-type tricarboxylate transporter receptor subunit TctC
VPFQSGVPAMNALLGNHVDIIAGPIAEIAPQVQQGKMRALVVTGMQRSRAFPDVPTLNESSLPGIDISGWNGFFAPAKIPRDIAAKLNGAINAVVKNPAVDQRMRQLAYEPYPVEFADAPAFFKNSIEAWARMIRLTGISGE